MRLIILFWTLALNSYAWGASKLPENHPIYQNRIGLWSVVTELPQSSIDSVKYSFTKESIPAWAAIVGSTWLTYYYDRDLYQGAMNDGKRWNISSTDGTKTVVEGFGYDLLRLPTDTGSWMYFLGDGWMHFGIAGGFLATGYFGDHNRPYNTALQMVHGMTFATFFSQFLKRGTGRETPIKATTERGRWRPFPSINAYNTRTSEYDAFPSGHVMTATLVFTVINTNYPEYFNYLFPIEALWITALGWQMVNNGVHWASDYPLAIGMGYVFGKMASRLGMKEREDVWNPNRKKETEVTYYPSYGEFGPMVNASIEW